MVRLSVDSLPDGWSAIVSEAVSIPLGYVGDAVDGALMRCSVSRMGPAITYRFIVDGVAFKASTLDGLSMRGSRFTLPAARERLVEAMGRSVMWRAAGLMRAGERAALEAVALAASPDVVDVRSFVSDPHAADVLSAAWFAPRGH